MTFQEKADAAAIIKDKLLNIIAKLSMMEKAEAIDVTDYIINNFRGTIEERNQIINIFDIINSIE